MKSRRMIIDGRTRLIGSIILDLGPVGSNAIRANLIERHGSNQYTDLTAAGVARHITRYMKNAVERHRVGKESQYAIRQGDGA